MRIVLMGLLIVLGGCANQASDRVSQLAATASVAGATKCSFEKVTGSYMKQQVCRSAAQAEVDRRNSRRIMLENQRLSNTMR